MFSIIGIAIQAALLGKMAFQGGKQNPITGLLNGILDPEGPLGKGNSGGGVGASSSPAQRIHDNGAPPPQAMAMAIAANQRD